MATALIVKLLNISNPMKTLKFIAFIPICLIALGLINLAFMFLLNWTIDRTNQWYNDLNILYFILLIPLFWGTIWGIFKLSAIGLAALLIPVSPDKTFSLYTLGIISILNCLALIIHYWVRDVNYSWKVVLMSMIISAFIVDFSISIVMVFSKKESHEVIE
jgi:hypothetical protein